MKDLAELFRRPDLKLEPGGRTFASQGPNETQQCPKCGRMLPKKKLQSALMVCFGCGYHNRLGARERLRMTVDQDSFNEMFGSVVSADPLGFPGYGEKLDKAAAASGENEAVICGAASIGSRRCAVFAMEPNFMMASMGSAVGERLTRLFEHALENRLAVVGFCASGGARMQEGALSLMQMAKVSGAVKWHGRAGNLYISVLTNPTTGGVTASFAMLGDIILAEPGALVGFAGRRVVEQTTKKKLPENFQSAEMVLKSGFIDAIVPRAEMRGTLTTLLKIHEGRRLK